jgi:hypothetical protein
MRINKIIKYTIYFIMDPKPADLTAEYLKSLTAKELQGYHIAKSHLGTSFNLEKSIGFLDWKQRNQK